jgi:hypothetical protein
VNSKLAVAAGFFGVLVVIALIQGLTVHKIGFGPLSVEFDKGSTSGSGGGGGPGPGGPQLPDPGDGDDFSEAKSVTGSWKKTSGPLTIEVIKVEAQDGRVKLTAKARNTAKDSLTLPLFKNFVATDNTGKTYEAEVGFNEEWHQDVPSGQTVTGAIELSDKVADGATKLTISFSTVFGSLDAPRGGVSVSGIPIPR